MTTADNFAHVPAPVVDAARRLVHAGDSRRDLLRALWIHRHAMTEQHYIATMLWIDTQLLPKGLATTSADYQYRWRTLIEVITHLLAVEAGHSEYTHLLQRNAADVIGYELGRHWIWDPGRPQSTVEALLYRETEFSRRADQVGPDSTLPGIGAILRFTGVNEFADTRRGAWRPDDEDDFVSEMRGALRSCGDVRIEAVKDSGGCPDIDVRAGIVQLNQAPWDADLDTQAWALIIDDEDGMTVIEYPGEDLALKGFNEHVDRRELSTSPYDYIVVPGARRTARPPATAAAV